jgi:hypothetical protein
MPRGLRRRRHPPLSARKVAERRLEVSGVDDSTGLEATSFYTDEVADEKVGPVQLKSLPHPDWEICGDGQPEVIAPCDTHRRPD